jgi:WD40 repeat protein
MFHSIFSCFNCVLTNHADVKELTPEFYNPNHDFDFLINARSLQLGATQNGDRVDDVTLPPWAKSHRDFLKKNRKALESEICTSMLPRWFDLIFGRKSRGEAAKDASNLFHKMAYMSPTDLASMSSEEERFQAELQATEFGICPDQLFTGPHPLRHETVDESFVNTEIGRTFSMGEEVKGEAWELLDAPSLEDANRLERTVSYDSLDPAGGASTSGADSNNTSSQPSRSLMSEDPNRNPFATMDAARQQRAKKDPNRLAVALSGSGEITDRQGGGGGAFSTLGQEPTLSNNSSSSGRANSSPRLDAAPTASATASDWDMKIIERTRFHEDALSGCCLLPEEGATARSVLVTTSLDGGLKVHNVSLGVSSLEDQQRKGITSTLSRFSYMTMSRGQVTPSSQTKLTEFRSHTSRDPLACLAVASDGYGGQVAFAGGHDDVVLAYGINSACAVASVYSHRDAVTGLDLIRRSPVDTASALWLEKSTHIMVSGSWDATVKVWSVAVSSGESVSINREPLAELFDADSSIVCVSATSVPEGGLVIGAGCADGSFCVWNLHSDGGESFCVL